MKLNIELDSREYVLEVRSKGSNIEFELSGARDSSGTASVERAAPNAYSVLLDDRSVAVHVAAKNDEIEIWADGERHIVSVRDARDDLTRSNAAGAGGRSELRSQMPGKVIKILAQPNDAVHAGHGLIVIEAMKMQNEIKSPVDGVVSEILVQEGATVAAGEILIVVE